jgi:hypothetical protein
MTRVAIVVPLRPRSYERAAQLLREGPPFSLEDTPLTGHCVHLTEREAVFVFEGPNARATVERIVGESNVWDAAITWRGLLAGKPRVAETVFSWQRDEQALLHVPGL